MNEKEIADRRKFLKGSMAGAAGFVVASTTGCALGGESEKKQKSALAMDSNITNKIDVLVVGGGTAGTIAAIQTGRAGAKTLLLERNSKLGGTTTTGGVSFPGLFDAWGKQIIAGIGWELVKDCVELDGGTFPDFSKVPDRHWKNQVRVNQFLYAILAEEKCAQAGVQIVYYEFPQAVTKTVAGWQVDCAGFGTQRRVLCKQIIDCTGGAEVVGMLNLPRLREEEIQPGSMLFQLDEANKPGRPNGPGTGLLDCYYIDGADSANSRTVTAANLKGRKAVLERVRKEKKRLMHMQPEAAFRESYRIEGETVITVDDYTSGRVFEDALCYAFYPVDVHKGTGFDRLEHLKPGIVPTIPLRALIPKDSRNIIVAGRCVSSDRYANGGLRVQASCMAMGQAAGAAAALAVMRGTTPLDVPLSEIHKLLRKHKAIVPA